MEQERFPISERRVLTFAEGEVLGHSHRWEGGQYCSITTPVGIVGCGIYDVSVADEFGMAFALAKGTPGKPLIQPEDLLDAKIVKVSAKARRMGISEGMAGAEAVRCMLLAAAKQDD
ncbi:MAG: DUF1805 domain-containing protein [Myxococcales bacterium]|nr:DUF1805 domain-containing protein [Myxococcales bacterium]